MTKVVSLSRANKAKERVKKRAQADANAVKFGRTKDQLIREETAAERAARDLEAHRRDPGGSER